ncbi:MAG: ArsR/SmtB family transcription factor [Candidatus Aenigmatarchaeota archaeon]
MIETIGSKKRLEILKLLSREDRYVSEIMDLAKMDGKNAKHHLEKLEETGLVESYKKGRRKYYKLKKEIRLEIFPPPEGKFLLYTTEE